MQGAAPLVEGASGSAVTSADAAKRKEACKRRCLLLLPLQSWELLRVCCRDRLQTRSCCISCSQTGLTDR